MHRCKALSGSPVALVLFITLTLTVCGRVAHAQVEPGDKITRENVEKVKDLVSPGVYWAVENGMDIDVVAYKKILVPKIYAEATEKYGGQTTLAEDNTVENWVAGKPFPTIDENDPHAAAKLMHNFEKGQYWTDDLNVHLPDADTGNFYVDANGNRRYNVEKHFIADWSRNLAFKGRLRHEPIHAFEENRDDTFRKQGFYPLIEPFDLKSVGIISYRYLSASRQDDTWLYVPVIRRVRRMSSAQRSDALFGQDIDLDSFGGYAGQIPWFEWKLIGSKPMLASFHGQNLPPKICERDGGMTYCEAWELRPKVYIVEGKAKMPNYAYSKRVIYVDAETSYIPYSDLYDSNGELWKVVIQSIRTSKKPNPNADLEYEDERMFIYAFSVLDMQLLHGTRAAIPGMQFPEEPAWYVDIGFDHEYSVNERWWTIAGLLSGGHAK
ncbi:MAG: DUF1329 domain-containing protein [Candidatus Binatia bacterium]